MRIISSFTDYYDSVMSYGVDQDKVYERKQKEDFVVVESQYSYPEGRRILSKEFSFMNHFRRDYDRLSNDIDLDFSVLLIAGKAYQVGVCRVKSHTFVPKDFEDLVKTCARVTDQKPQTVHSQLTYVGSRYYRRSMEGVARTVESIGACVDVGDDIFFEYGAPLLLVRGVRTGENVFSLKEGSPHTRDILVVKENPCLTDVGFQSIMDPFTTFQTLSTYLSGVLGEAHPPMVNISDEDMKVAKGFGHKYAFKKEPEKR